ncbi:MAG: glutamine-hydrolyzing GMP synthase [Saprospiraceae bacterium]|nr:glutamine-hydrolyzing GMP synthase [Saprospiraceae bacterium]
MKEKIIILDFGSQYTQLIARRVRELQVFCEILPYYDQVPLDETVRGVILSGSPFSVKDANALRIDLNALLGNIPVLGICYGAQLIADELGGNVSRSEKREYGKAKLKIHQAGDPFLADLSSESQVWMSHADTILALPDSFELLAGTQSIDVAAFSYKQEGKAPVYGIQFHPEVTHSLEGKAFIRNFLYEICHCHGDWTPDSFVEETIDKLKQSIGDEHVLMALSGGVDSTVGAVLLHHAIGKQLHCFFIDNGLLRKDEFEQVLSDYQHMGLNIKGVDAKERFWTALAGVSDPETKRKIIGREFIHLFEEESRSLPGVSWLGQGTIYPDVIESNPVQGPSAMIKSHHNVGGLPEKLHLKIIEPLRMLFKDEVRKVGIALGISNTLIQRHPFPGPGLGIRILGDITPEKVRLLQEADAIYIQMLKDYGLYDQVWQAGTILLPVQSVGVMGDERTYESAVALRAVNSLDGMTAEWSKLPYEFLADVSSAIINRVKGINRVVYDISTKPPATIEWE